MNNQEPTIDSAKKRELLDQDTREVCEKISAEVMRPLVTQKEYVYIDADLLFDFRLGALLASMTRGEADYQHIKQNLQTYLDAPTLECAKFFPEMKVTDEQLDAMIADPKYRMTLAAITPATKLLNQLPMIVRVINTINVSKETQRPVRFTINQRLFPLTDFQKNAIRERAKTGDGNAYVEFTNFANWNEVPESVLNHMDVICIYDIRDFLKEGTTSQRLIAKTDEFAMCDIMALPQSDLPAKDTDLGLRNLADVMSLLCNKFSFVKKSLLSQGD